MPSVSIKTIRLSGKNNKYDIEKEDKEKRPSSGGISM